MVWPPDLEKLLRKALSAEEQAVAIYSAEVDVFRRKNRKDRALYEGILEEEKSHRSEISLALKNPPASRWDLFGGYLFGRFLAMIPTSWNYSIHIWAEREAAKAYFFAWKKVRSQTGAEAIFRELRTSLWKQTKQELSHRRRFQQALKKETL